MGQPTILVIEDDSTDFLLLERAFRKAQIAAQLHWSKNGLHAIDYLKELKEAGKAFPVLILSDLKMPLLDGFDVLQVIKADPLLRAIPVVVLTGSARDADISKCYELGTNSYLVKPSDFNSLIEASKTLHRYWISLNRTIVHSKH